MKKELYILLLFIFYQSTIWAQNDLLLNWAKSINSPQIIEGEVYGQSIKVDDLGNTYVLGNFNYTADFDPSDGVANLTSNTGNLDIFIAKYDALGNYVYAKAIGGTSDDSGTSVAVDDSGNVYITGSFSGTVDFDPSTNEAVLISKGSNDIFLAKFDSSGNYVYAIAIGEVNTDGGTSIAVDSSGNAYLTGYFVDTVDFDPSDEVANLSSIGSYDIFIAKYDASGNYVYAKAIGGNDFDMSNSVSVDFFGNVYITGYFFGTADFDPTAGVAMLSSVGNNDIFLAKYDASGNYLYAKAIGGTNDDAGNSVTVDGSGNAYLTGYFTDTVDFDPSIGVAILNSVGDSDIFLAKYDAFGNYVYAKAVGGNLSDTGKSVAIDGFGNAYLTGYFYGTADFDPSVGVSNLTSAGGFDIFLAKYDNSGNYVYAKAIEGVSEKTCNSIAVDGLGNAYITGYLYGTADFDPSAGTANLTTLNNPHCFIGKYDSTGNYLWAKLLGGYSAQDEYIESRAIVRDALGNMYITGYFFGTFDFDPSSVVTNLTSNARTLDIFLAKYDSSGNYVYAKAIGGSGNDYGYSLAVDDFGNAYITGYFTLTVDFDPSAEVANLTSNAGSQDIFLAKYDSSGNYVYAKAIGGTNSEVGNSVAVDGSGNAYITGYFVGFVDFDPSAGVAILSSNSGSQDIFLAKYDASGNYLFAKAIGGSNNEVGNSVAVDNSSNAYITGYFAGTADFDPSSGVVNLTSMGNNDVFFAKYDALGNYMYAKAIGGPEIEGGTSVAVDDSGNAYITGYFFDTVDFDPSGGVANHTSMGNNDVFFAKYDASGNYVYARFIGSLGYDIGNCVTVDSSGNAYITGYFSFTADFDPSVGVANLTSAGGFDIFLAKYDASGNYKYAKVIGGPQYDSGNSVAVDGLGNAYITGNFIGTSDFDPSAESYVITANNQYADFIAKYTEYTITTGSVATSVCTNTNVALPYTVAGAFANGNVFTAQLSDAVGSFANPVNIGTVSGTASGSINGLIPLNTLTGTGYRIRVVSSNPAVTGGDNGSNITINTQYDFYTDADGDGYGMGETVSVCAIDASTPPSGFSVNNTDCNNTNPNVHPGVIEVCNGIDDNCDGQIDEGCNSNPFISINDVTVNESNGNAIITVSLSKRTTSILKISYTTKDGTATTTGKNKDYSSTKGNLSIAAGSLSGSIIIPIIKDNISESSEYFDVILSVPKNATILDGSGRVTILNGSSTAKNVDKQENALTGTEFSVVVYPNPSNNNFNLEVQSGSNEPIGVFVFDNIGRLKYSKEGTLKAQYQFGASFPAGVYILEVRQGNESISKKVMKK